MATSYAGGKNRTDFFAANSLDTGVVKVTALTMAATNCGYRRVSESESKLFGNDYTRTAK